MSNRDEPSVDDVISVIIDFLAEYEEIAPDELREHLEREGRELPVDSLLVVEILTRIEERYHVAIPADREAAQATRSVRAFAAAVLDAIVERQQS
ncbi:acyl carrier protein [Streptomyces sp. NPDC088124]|uniref:acyl carrier protein n=1 Tax=Streptomyces sp. NPDC088124 TaxID=3154654 RepID=UPI00342A9FA0